MRINFFVLFICSSIFFSCGNQQPPAEKGSSYGEVINSDNAISVAQLIKMADAKQEVNAKVKGEVEAVCQVKGCWMTLKKPDGGTMRVTFKDYGFFMPKNISGKTIIADGIAKVETTDVATLRHFAEDQGLPAEEIEKITEPETELTFEASGVIVL